MNPESPSQILRSNVNFFFPLLGTAGARMASSPDFSQLYPSYLMTIHSMIRATVPLMERGLDMSQRMAQNDPFCDRMCDYLTQHIREEANHDEWVLDDLEVMGYSREEVLSHQPSSTVAAMVGSQYYWINHFHPIALLGYIAAMEGSPPRVEVVDTWPQKTGYPPEAFRTIRKHAILDPHHKRDLDEFIDSLPFDESEDSFDGLDIITYTAISTIKFAARAVDEVWEIPLGPPRDLEVVMYDYDVAPTH